MLEAILAKVNTSGQRLYSFLSGLSDEQIYDVSFRNTTSDVSSVLNSMVSIAQEILGLGSIGIQISQIFIITYYYFQN